MSKTPSVSAIIVTRGDVDLSQILASIPEKWETVVWNNGSGEVRRNGRQHVAWPDVQDLAVYGRYAAIEYATGELIYVQDDDCVLDTDQMRFLAEMRKPGEITANMPYARWKDYPDSCLVGFGAVFDRDLPERAFERFRSTKVSTPPGHSYFTIPDMGQTGWACRTCDVVFTTLTEHSKIDLGHQDMPWASGPGRMFTEAPKRHRQERQRMLEIARKIRDS